ncbi:MAG TPA: metallophosphoesterase [Coriobacteriia bacterium]|nr:metallophosphoesterase [Coriobacteriia bacterium]
MSTTVWRTVHVGPLVVKARPAVGWPGQTSLRVPPFGEAVVRTHIGPARLSLTVESVDVPAVQRLLARDSEPSQPGAATLREQAAQATATVSEVIEGEARSARRDIAALAALAALVAAVVSGIVLLALRRRFAVVVAGTVLGFALVIGSASVAVSTFNPAALASPRLEGALSYVPRLQTIFSARLSQIEQLRGQVSKIAQDLAAYYADPRSIAPGGGLPGTFRVLHVSDLHMDPVGAELARSLARSYEASLVIDTGDLAIAGSAEEAALLPSLVVTSVPEVFVPGNHDSAVILAALERQPNITVAGTSTVTIEGFTILPVPDPSGEDPGIEPDRAAVESATQAARTEIETRAAADQAMPDIIAAHNPLAERSLIDLAQVILSGHTHSARLYRMPNGGVRVNSGTIGGMPYDPVVTGRDRLPHGASILYYTSELPRRLIAVDLISVGVDGTTTLDRTVIDATLLP